MRISRLHLPRRTARLRLALLYGGVFVLGATVVTAITYLLAASNNPEPSLPASLSMQIKEAEESALDQAAFNQAASDREHLLIWSGIALAAAIAAAVVLGWFIAGRVLRPLSTITAAARRISASSLHERLALPGPHDEL